MKQTDHSLMTAHTYITEMLSLLVLVAFIENQVYDWSSLQAGKYLLLIILLLGLSFVIASKLSLRFMYILMAIGGVAAYLLGFTWLSIVVIGVISAIRLEKLHSINQQQHIPTIMVLSFVAVFMILLVIPMRIENLYRFYYHLLIAMFVFYFIGKLSVQILTSSLSQKPAFQTLFKIILFLVGCILIGMIIYQPFIQLLSFIVNHFFVLILTILSPILNILQKFFASIFDVEQMMDQEMFESESLLSEDMVQERANNNNFSEYLAYIIIGIIILIIAWQLYRYFKDRGQLSRQKDASMKNKQIHRRLSKQDSQAKKIPLSQVRKEYFRFEQWLAKRGKGRYVDETIEEWMNRMKIDHLLDKETIDMYQRFRYRDEDLSEQEFTAFKAAIKEFKQTL